MFAADPMICKNPAVEERRLGRLSYTHEFLVNTSPIAVQNLFSKIIPVSVIFDYADQCFNVVAFSNSFEPVEAGARIPEYQIVIRVVKSISKKSKKLSYYVSFNQVENNSLSALFS